MGIIQTAEGWLFNVALKRVVAAGVKLGLAFLVSHNAVSFGVNMDPDKVLAGAYMGLEAFHDWLKVKTGWTW